MIAVFILTFIFLSALVVSKDFYIFVIYHKDWKLWKKLNRLPKDHFTKLDPFHYSIKGYPNWRVVITQNYTFVADDDCNCVLCSFYESESRKLYKKLINENS